MGLKLFSDKHCNSLFIFSSLGLLTHEPQHYWHYHQATTFEEKISTKGSSTETIGIFDLRKGKHHSIARVLNL